MTCMDYCKELIDIAKKTVVENIEFETRIYVGKLVCYPCIWGKGFNFESVGSGL